MVDAVGGVSGMPSAKKNAPETSRTGKRRASAPRKAPARAMPKAQTPAPAFDLNAALAQASWKEADEALAKALRDFTALEKVSQTLGRKLRGDPLSTHAQQVEDALWAVSQSLRHAGRRRNLQRFGEVGGIEAFDESRHALAKTGKSAPVRVRVIAQGVMRGLGLEAEIVLKALVTPLSRSANAPRKAI